MRRRRRPRPPPPEDEEEPGTPRSVAAQFELGLNENEFEATLTRQHCVSLHFVDRNMELAYREQQVNYILSILPAWIAFRAISNWVVAAATFDYAAAAAAGGGGSSGGGRDDDDNNNSSPSPLFWVMFLVHHLAPLLVLLLLEFARKRVKSGRKFVRLFELVVGLHVVTDTFLQAAVLGYMGRPMPASVVGTVVANILTRLPWYHHSVLGGAIFAIHAGLAAQNGTLDVEHTMMTAAVLPFMVMFARFADRAMRQVGK